MMTREQVVDWLDALKPNPRVPRDRAIWTDEEMTMALRTTLALMDERDRLQAELDAIDPVQRAKGILP